MRPDRLLANALILALFCSLRLLVANAQNQNSASPSLLAANTGPQMRVVIDGSRQPELIPDRIAVAMFLSAIAIPANADATDEAYMKAKVKRMKLSKGDMNVLRGELSGLHGRLQAQQKVIESAFADAKRQRSPQTDARATAAKEGKYTLTWESYTRLRKTLSEEGARQLITQIGRVKLQMKAVAPHGQ